MPWTEVRLVAEATSVTLPTSLGRRDGSRAGSEPIHVSGGLWTLRAKCGLRAVTKATGWRRPRPLFVGCQSESPEATCAGQMACRTV